MSAAHQSDNKSAGHFKTFKPFLAVINAVARLKAFVVIIIVTHSVLSLHSFLAQEVIKIKYT